MKQCKIVTWNSNVVENEMKRQCECQYCYVCDSNSKQCRIFGKFKCIECKEWRCSMCIHRSSLKCNYCRRR